MNRTSNLLPFKIPRWRVGALLILMLIGIDWLSAQTSPPFPAFKPKQTVLQIAQQEKTVYENQLRALGPNMDINDPATVRLMLLRKVYHEMFLKMSEPTTTVSSEMVHIYTMFQVGVFGTAGNVTTGNYLGNDFYSGNWNSDFRNMVNLFKI